MKRQWGTLQRPEPPTPEEGTEDDRVFEPLALMDSNDLDQVLVTFQAQLCLFIRGGVGLAPLCKPREQSRHTGTLTVGRGLEEFGHVQKVGEPALAIPKSQQA